MQQLTPTGDHAVLRRPAGLARIRHTALLITANAVDSAGCALALRRLRPAGNRLMHMAENLYCRANDIEFAASGIASRQEWFRLIQARDLARAENRS